MPSPQVPHMCRRQADAMTETPRSPESPVLTDNTPTPPTGFQHPLFVPPQPEPPRRKVGKGTAVLVGAAVLAAVVGGGAGYGIYTASAQSTVVGSVSSSTTGTTASNNT